ncbi:MAG: GNAT family N-acetyltransferase [Pseudomonadota bacterium]
MNLTIRSAGPDDLAAIVMGNQSMAMETESKQLPAEVLEPGVSSLLADASLGRYWIAEVDGQYAGQIMVTLEWSDWRNGHFWWIQSVFIASQFRRQGVFTALYEKVQTDAKSAHAVGLRLYVERENAGAIATYEALGMSEPDYKMMEVTF